MNARRGVGLVGLVILGLAPSFLDWQQSPEKRRQFVGYYAVAIALVYWGLIRA